MSTDGDRFDGLSFLSQFKYLWTFVCTKFQLFSQLFALGSLEKILFASETLFLRKTQPKVDNTEALDLLALIYLFLIILFAKKVIQLPL